MPETETVEIPDLNVEEYGTTNLHVGVEVEYPTTNGREETTFSKRGRNTSDFKSQWVNEHGRDWPVGGNMTGDPTVGAEIVSEVLDVHQAIPWYRDTIEESEAFGFPHEPCGEMSDSSNRTAGLHIHLSTLTTEQARALYQLSQEPWMKAFACSTLWQEGEREDYRVFRGGQYCQFDTFNSGRYSAVHAVNSASGHYEWRMPEPMTADHFDLMMEFLTRFSTDVQDAARFARDKVYNGHEAITSIQRADALNLDLSEPEEEESDEVEGSVSRMPLLDTEAFYNRIRDASNAPYIYRVDVENEGTFYAFESHTRSDAEYLEPETGIRFSADDVLHADSLGEVTRSSLVDDVQEIMTRPVEVQTDDDDDEIVTEAAELIHEVRSA